MIDWLLALSWLSKSIWLRRCQERDQWMPGEHWNRPWLHIGPHCRDRIFFFIGMQCLAMINSRFYKRRIDLNCISNKSNLSIFLRWDTFDMVPSWENRLIMNTIHCKHINAVTLTKHAQSLTQILRILWRKHDRSEVLLLWFIFKKYICPFLEGMTLQRKVWSDSEKTLSGPW